MMIQQIKSVLIGLTKKHGPDETSSALSYGLSLAQQAGAHVTIQVSSLKLGPINAGVSRVAGGLVLAENERLHALAEAVTRSAEADAAAAGVPCSTRSPHLSYSELVSSFKAQAHVHDLTILDAEAESFDVDRGLFETMLLDSGRPVIVIPPGVTIFGVRRVIVAWDGSSKAARATNDAGRRRRLEWQWYTKFRRG
jgi:hypothetical protein